MVGLSPDSIGSIILPFSHKKIKTNSNCPETGTVRKLDEVLYMLTSELEI